MSGADLLRTELSAETIRLARPVRLLGDDSERRCLERRLAELRRQRSVR